MLMHCLQHSRGGTASQNDYTTPTQKKVEGVLGDESFNMPSNHVSHCLSVLRPTIFFQQLGRREHIEETTAFFVTSAGM